MPEEKIDLQIVRKFGPSILKVKIPNNILNNLNSQIDEILANKERQKTLDYGNKLVGDVTQEFQLERGCYKKWMVKFFIYMCSKWIEIETGKKITKFNLISTWVVRQFENEYNPTHWHGGHISGAGFLKLPKSFGETKQKKTNGYSGGNLQLIHGSTMFMCDSVFNIKPEVGDFYFFPNYLMHAVFPFKDSKEERRSISFNAHIDENIYNVYE